MVLDIEVAGAVAPGANIVVYFAPNLTDQNFLDALTTAIHDTKNKPSVISISWGGPEIGGQPQRSCSSSTPRSSRRPCSASRSARRPATTGPPTRPRDAWDGQPHVDFPSASPWILSCGGTSLTASGGKIASETVWNQHGADPQSHQLRRDGRRHQPVLPGSRLPAGHRRSQPRPGPAASRAGASRTWPATPTPPPATTCWWTASSFQGFGGTSAVAPLWAGLIALINQGLGTRAGFVNTLLYSRARAAGAFHDITQGDNKVGPNAVGYAATAGWDACTGLGTPDGQKILAALKGP